MERLTVDNWEKLDPWECCGQDRYCIRPSNKQGGCRNGCIVPKLYERLAQYEDTGLSPEEVKKDRWIPCSERLPETNGKDASYLVYVPSFGAVDIADYHPDVDEWTFMCLPVTVTHWQPLPEPPEEGDAGNGLD